MIAFLGVAHIHVRDFVNLLLAQPKPIVKWVWDHQSDRRQKIAALLHCRQTGSLTEVLSDPEVSAVLICSETNRHSALVQAAVAARKDIFVEKPLALSSPEAFELASLIEQSAVKFHTGFFLRTEKAFEQLKALLMTEGLGRVVSANISFGHPGILSGWFEGDWDWMVDAQQNGPGAFGDLAIHLIDLLIWLCGPVHRAISITSTTHHRNNPFDDGGHGLLEFRNGTLATISASQARWSPTLGLAIDGMHGSCFLQNGTLTLAGPAIEDHPSWICHPIRCAAEDALTVFLMRNEMPAPKLIAAREAAEGVAVVEALYHSIHSREWREPRLFGAAEGAIGIL